MRLLPRLAAAFLACLWLGAAGQPAPRMAVLDSAARALLDRVSAYLNSIHSLKSGFVLINPNRSFTEGTFYLQKPGQLRFEYRPPNPTLMVGTGGRIYIKNSRLNTVDRYDIADTPLGLLLNDTVDLAHNRAVIGVHEQDGAIIVNARTSTNRNNSNITMVFSAPALELRQWTVKDNQGGLTTVALRDLQVGATLDETLFAPLTKTAVARKQVI